MTFTGWLSIVAVCTAGAMSPGPSLAVVIRNTVQGDRKLGVVTGLSHALGIVIYAFVTAIGVGVLVTESPLLFTGIKYAGALFLLWLAYKALRGPAAVDPDSRSPDSRVPNSDLTALLATHEQVKGYQHNVRITDAVRDGVLISILNPKIILFFLALFSQFVDAGTGWGEAVLIAATAGAIDAGWYVLVAVFISQPLIRGALAKHIGVIEKVFGLLLIAIAVQVIVQAVI